MPAKRIAFLSAVAAGCFSLNAPAFYYGVGAGQATDTQWDESMIQDGSVSSIALEDQDTSFRLFGGVELDRNLAFEVAYVNFGQQTAEGDADGSGSYWGGGPAAVTSEVDGFDFGLVGTVPLSGDLSLLARIGVLAWEGNLTYEDPSFVDKFRDTGSDVFFGGGLEFDPDGPLAVRGEYSRYSIDGIDVDNVSVSLMYRFWDRPARRHVRRRY